MLLFSTPLSFYSPVGGGGVTAAAQDIRDTHGWLAARLQRWRQHHDKERVEAAERAELLGDAKLPASVVAALDEEGQSYDRSSNKVGGLVDSAYGAIAELAAQRELLKGTQRRVLDMLTTLGVSRSTIRVIERRNVVDRAIVWGGMAVTTVALYLLLRWVR
jgi:Golgi SNAP receptor complex protein 2